MGEAQPGAALQELLCHCGQEALLLESLPLYLDGNQLESHLYHSRTSNTNKEPSGGQGFLRHLRWQHLDEGICSGSRDEKDNKPQLLSLMVQMFCRNSEKVGLELAGPLDSTEL